MMIICVTGLRKPTGVEVVSLFVRKPREGKGGRSESETYISGTHDTANLLHGVKIRAQTAVHGEDLLVNNSGDG
jgi:hypothetical protein